MSTGEPISEKTIQELASANKELIKTFGPGSRLWELVKLALPVLLTALLGGWTWYLQYQTQKQVNENTQNLSAKLALSEEFYKRKLSVYEDASKNIGRLRQSLERLADQSIDPGVSTAAADSISAIDDMRRSDLLYMSDDLKQHLAQLWDLGMARMQAGGENGPQITTAMQKVDDEVRRLEQQMRDDLQTKTIGQTPGAAPPAAP
jgi:hypothetical protein